MKIDFDEVTNQEQELAAMLLMAEERSLECLRARVFPTPSPFGIDWEKQRVAEIRDLLVRWSQGRKKNGYHLATIQGGDTADLPSSARQHLTADRQSRAIQLA